MWDLVTDVSWNYEVKKLIKPFKPREPDARLHRLTLGDIALYLHERRGDWEGPRSI